jgi:hypothetical protein
MTKLYPYDTLAGRARWLARGNPSRRGETFSSDPTNLYYPEAFWGTKEVVPVQKYIDPVSEKIEDSLDQAELFEDIAASYSVTQEEISDDDLDPIVPIRPAQALAAIRTFKDWEEQQDDSTQQVIKQLKDLEKHVRAL